MKIGLCYRIARSAENYPDYLCWLNFDCIILDCEKRLKVGGEYLMKI